MTVKVFQEVDSSLPVCLTLPGIPKPNQARHLSKYHHAMTLALCFLGNLILKFVFSNVSRLSIRRLKLIFRMMFT